ncbi:MAG: hypothetical protein ACU841_13070 [Gammaproteobacteria bacterium]
MLGFVFAAGLILLYFLNIALLKTSNLFDPNWLLHSWLRFLVGFLILGISSFYTKGITFKSAIFIIMILDAADYLYDVSLGSYRLQLEIILHGIYMMTWGSLMGYLTAKRLTAWIENHYKIK